MKVAIVFLGTGRYINFFEKFYQTTSEMLLPNTEKAYFIATDQVNSPVLNGKSRTALMKIDDAPWPAITLFRFEYIVELSKYMSDCDKIMFIDADMYINRVITEEEFFCHDKPLYGVQHPGFVNNIGTFENDSRSTAFVDMQKDDVSTYWQGCFWGGDFDAIVDMCNELRANVKTDLENSFIARWHDESHLNRYFITHKDKVYTHDPGFAYPERWDIPFEKKIIHVYKEQSEFPRFEGPPR